MFKGTKAQVLEKLHLECRDVNTLPFFIVKYEEYISDKAGTANRIIGKFCGSSLAVRSSCTHEDTNILSNAGKYCSKLNVPPEETEINAAIEEVFASYDECGNEEVLVQPMLDDIIKSGVIFTRDLYTFAPYYCIDYCCGSDSAAVTSGTDNSGIMTVIYRGSEKTADEDINKLIEAASVIEDFFGSDALDIEFAFNGKHELYIFQVRPMAGAPSVQNNGLSNSLMRISKKIKKLMSPRPFLLGDTTYFGVMTDWNPAEILGSRPKKLAASLYKELVTDNIWSNQREIYGYRDLTKHPLMVLFCGVPYIDIRITFNSFVPAELNEKIADKLVNYYLSELKQCPAYHDKIEFEIVYSCYYPGLSDDLSKLLDKGFSAEELKRIEFSLLNLTNRIINPVSGLYIEDLKKAEILEKNYKTVLDSELSTVDKIYWLLEICKTYGTLPFAGVARAAFIAVQFLRSFVKNGIITEKDYSSFMCSLNTISKQLSADRRKMSSGSMSKEEFLEKYGHIRPGTYDILSPRYDEAFESYFRNSPENISGAEQQSFEFDPQIMERLDRELEMNGLDITAEGLIKFIKDAIEGREYLKFVFSKVLSRILVLIGQLGERLDINKEELAHLDADLLKNPYTDLYDGNIREVLKSNIEMNKKQYRTAEQLRLPSVIFSPMDVYRFTMMHEEPNFITLKTAVGFTVTEEKIYTEELSGSIVFLRSADPGYDFLFARNIGGLVTQYGGANSHMAIRCSELGIPAVIGAGEKNFNFWIKAETLLLDCAEKKVKILEGSSMYENV